MCMILDYHPPVEPLGEHGAKWQSSLTDGQWYGPLHMVVATAPRRCARARQGPALGRGRGHVRRGGPRQAARLRSRGWSLRSACASASASVSLPSASASVSLPSFPSPPSLPILPLGSFPSPPLLLPPLPIPLFPSNSSPPLAALSPHPCPPLLPLPSFPSHPSPLALSLSSSSPSLFPLPSASASASPTLPFRILSASASVSSCSPSPSPSPFPSLPHPVCTILDYHPPVEPLGPLHGCCNRLAAVRTRSAGASARPGPRPREAVAALGKPHACARGRELAIAGARPASLPAGHLRGAAGGRGSPPSPGPRP